MRRVVRHLEQIEQLTPAEVKPAWEAAYGSAPPAMAVDLLRLGLAYRVQEQRLGGLGRETMVLLRAGGRAGNSAATPARKLTPGTRLVRDWHGVGHSVTVLEIGFAYDGRTWSSLSAIASAITGTKWNGPRFFGVSR